MEGLGPPYLRGNVIMGKYQWKAQYRHNGGITVKGFGPVIDAPNRLEAETRLKAWYAAIFGDAFPWKYFPHGSSKHSITIAAAAAAAAADTKAPDTRSNVERYKAAMEKKNSEPDPKADVMPPNPKQIFGDKKPRLSLIPLSGQLAQWEAHYDGALKYGEVNWTLQPVEAMTYIDAAIRHLQLYKYGEKYARDTNVQNLGAVMACCAIVIDADAHGTLIDNRTISPVSCDLLHGRGEEMVKHLNEMQKQRMIAHDIEQKEKCK